MSKNWHRFFWGGLEGTRIVILSVAEIMNSIINAILKAKNRIQIIGAWCSVWIQHHRNRQPGTLRWIHQRDNYINLHNCLVNCLFCSLLSFAVLPFATICCCQRPIRGCWWLLSGWSIPLRSMRKSCKQIQLAIETLQNVLRHGLLKI